MGTMKAVPRPSLALVLVAGMAILLATSCAGRTPVASPGASRPACEADASPASAETAQAVARCLGPQATAAEALQLLSHWQRAAEAYWGSVTAADILPGGGDELILTYHADLPNVIWHPQGQLAILQAQADGWQVAFESPTPTDETTDGRTTLAGNWSYHVAAVGDLTGDGVADLLFEQRWSNGTHGYLSYTKLLTADAADPAPVRLLYFEEGSITQPHYLIADQTVHSIVALNGQDALTRTYRLEGTTFTLVAKTINPAAALLSATTADGAGWYAFDRVEGMRVQPLGLYRLQAGALTHYAVPALITWLEVLPDGYLYVGGSGALFRVEAAGLVDLLAGVYAPVTTASPWQTRDLALTQTGDLWVAGQLALLQLGRQRSVAYPLLATHVLAAPDDSVWALGWNGTAENDCCYYHLQAGQVTEYKYTAPLPVSADLEQQLRAFFRPLFPGVLAPCRRPFYRGIEGIKRETSMVAVGPADCLCLDCGQPTGRDQAAGADPGARTMGLDCAGGYCPVPLLRLLHRALPIGV